MDKEQHNIIIYSSPDGKTNVSLMTRDGKVWLNQSQISDLFGTSVQNVSYHIINILKDKELDENSVIKDYLITASDDKAGKSFAENGKMRIFAAPKKKSDDFWCNGVLPERV